MSHALEVSRLETTLTTRRGAWKAVDDVSFSVAQGETLAIVGESGCGKSLTALSIMGLLPDPPARVTGGQVLLEGQDLLALPHRAMRAVRGRDIAMIFQDPMSALNPVMPVGKQLTEVLRAHTDLSGKDAWKRAQELLELVRIPDAARRLHEYPHNLSGGTCQRVMIAMAVACRPKVLIADEPTTALDVTIQAQILDLLRGLQQETGMALVLITHDLGVVAAMADRVMVMYAGRKVEEAAADAIFDTPLHPYTAGLLGATPSHGGVPGGRLADIPGMVPQPNAMPLGCRFAPRCAEVMPRCLQESPALLRRASGRSIACFAAEQKEVADALAVGS